FIYFMQTELGMKNIGLADDELDGGMALIPYNREGRRVKGVVRMNINHIKNPYDASLYRTGISVGDYPVDHHHARYPGKVPEIEFPPIPAYNIPMGALIPSTIDGLIVCEKGISVTNIVNGTTRLQPVVLLTGQAAGVLAAKTVQLKKKVREVPVRLVQEELLKMKTYLMPFVDVKPTDPHWEAIQKVGVTGILKGTGKAEGWGNKMCFFPDSLVTIQTLPYREKENSFMTLDDLGYAVWKMYNNNISGKEISRQDFFKAYTGFIELTYKTQYRPLSLVFRREVAVVVDHFLKPIKIQVNHAGEKK
nr:FAD-dependent oxidoreductase [Chitinophagaceae bacterium]MBP7315537.1 FAD-dependent oxidoreductase [Chitinophagaceae bacterium]